MHAPQEIFRNLDASKMFLMHSDSHGPAVIDDFDTAIILATIAKFLQSHSNNLCLCSDF